jgi:hypothetical protein
LVVSQLRDVSSGDIATARSKCLAYSRIGDLEKFIEERFFSQRDIIKKNQILQKAQHLYSPSIRTIAAEAERIAADAQCAQHAAGILSGSSMGLSSWLNAKALRWKNMHAHISEQTVKLDREWLKLRDDLEGLRTDLELSEFMDQNPGLFPLEDQPKLRALCDHLASPHRRSQLGQQRLVTLPELRMLIDRYRVKGNCASRRYQRLYEHITRRLEEVLQIISHNE